MVNGLEDIKVGEEQLEVLIKFVWAQDLNMMELRLEKLWALGELEDEENYSEGIGASMQFTNSPLLPMEWTWWDDRDKKGMDRFFGI